MKGASDSHDEPLPDALRRDLEAAVGVAFVKHSALDRVLAGRDASTIHGQGACVVLPKSTAEVQAVVRACRRHGRAFAPRGSGTGLSAGAVPCGLPVVISTTRMTAIRLVDVVQRTAWVEPGVLNLDLSNFVAAQGFRFAPDPSSQQSCSIGGNVANNSGGPHCLSEGVTQSHVLAIEVVMADGEVVMLGGLDPEPVGLDLRGGFIGSEGTCGIATAIAVRLVPLAPAVSTMLVVFDALRAGAECVSAIIAAGLVPGALEMMDHNTVVAVEPFAHAGLPLDCAAVLLVELEGLRHQVAFDTTRVSDIALAHGAREVRLSSSDDERARWWKARKSAFGAIARMAPDYYLHDTVVPRAALVGVLEEVVAIANRYGLQVLNVFHAGDGNLHPLLVYDGRVEGELDRVHQAGAEIVRASVAAGGMLSGEHGIGLEKRDFMPLVFSAHDLAAQGWLRNAFDPDGAANPDKVLPTPHSCGDVVHLTRVPDGAWV
jgi:glycolate oxidase